jgi:hypothetical protein
MKKEIAIFCFFVALIVAVAGIMIYEAQEAQLDIDCRNESKENYRDLLVKYENLSAEYNQTSRELNEINKWFLENNLSIKGENITIDKTKIVIMEVPYKFINENKTWTSLEITMGFNEKNKFFIKVSTFDFNETEITHWNCTGEECLLPILRDIEDKGDWYEWKGLWLRKKSDYIAALMNISGNRTMQGMMSNNGEGKMFICLNETSRETVWIGSCSGIDCLNIDCLNITLNATQ